MPDQGPSQTGLFYVLLIFRISYRPGFHLRPAPACGNTSCNSNGTLPDIPDYATNNAHMFYLVCNSIEERTALIRRLKENGVQAVFHYLSLHSSPYYLDKHDGRELPNCDRYADCLVRLPMYFDLNENQVDAICELIHGCQA